MGSGQQHTALRGEENGVPAMGSTMKAIVQDGYGSAEVLRLARIAPPQAGSGEVVLRVHAAGLDRGSWHMMTGQAVCPAPGRRLARAAEPGGRAGRGGHRRGGRPGSDPVLGRG